MKQLMPHLMGAAKAAIGICGGLLIAYFAVTLYFGSVMAQHAEMLQAALEPTPIPLPPLAQFSGISAQWNSYSGRYLTISGKITNVTKDEVIKYLFWSDELTIVTAEGKSIQRRGGKTTFTTDDGLEAAFGAALASALSNPVGPAKSAGFKIDGELWGGDLRVDKAELLYSIASVRLTLTLHAVTPSGQVYSETVFEGDIPTPNAAKRFVLKK